MKFNVYMLAFMNGEIREVEVPDKECQGSAQSVLERIFYWGQNDFQPVEGRASVSVGDVVDYFGKYFVVAGTGWKEITPQKLSELQAIASDPVKRREHSMDYYFDNETKNNKETTKMSNFNLSGYLKNIFSSKNKDKEKSDQIETKLVEKNKDQKEPEELTEGLLEKDRNDTEETITEKQLEKVRAGSNEMLVEGQLNKSKSTIVKHRNAETANGDINKLEEKRLAGETMESEKQEPASVMDKPRRFYKNKSPDGLKLAKSMKINKISQGFDIDTVQDLPRTGVDLREKLPPDVLMDLNKMREEEEEFKKTEDEDSPEMREKARQDVLEDSDVVNSLNKPEVLNSIFSEEIVGTDDSSGTMIEERKISFDLKEADETLVELFTRGNTIDENLLKQAIMKYINLNHIEDVVDEDALDIEINRGDISGSATYIVPIEE